MRCPVCHDEYEPDVVRCVDCDVPLLAADAPLPARVDALLGTFHPVVAERILALVAHRGIAADAVPADGRVEVIVDREWRDDLRAELVVGWADLVARLPDEERRDVVVLGGPQPGWHDPPRGAWIDRQGRLQVDPTDDEVEEADASRVVGPALLAIGAVLLLFAWYEGGGSSRAIAVVLGLGSIGLGLFVPR
ncbi:MAG: hypothetical protein KY457_01205 [Actinobacteria bacterium]|nr:hypothetical protein [Actinomycetota bacterium]